MTPPPLRVTPVLLEVPMEVEYSDPGSEIIEMVADPVIQARSGWFEVELSMSSNPLWLALTEKVVLAPFAKVNVD